MDIKKLLAKNLEGKIIEEIKIIETFYYQEINFYFKNFPCYLMVKSGPAGHDGETELIVSLIPK